MIVQRTYMDKLQKPITFYCDLGRGTKDELKNFKVFGCFAEDFNSSCVNDDHLEIEMSIKLSCSGKPLEILKIFAGNNKRLGRGTLGLLFIEKELIPVLNSIINKIYPEENIKYIYGIISSFNDDISDLGRLKFYNKNGYIISNSHFYKYIS